VGTSVIRRGFPLLWGSGLVRSGGQGGIIYFDSITITREDFLFLKCYMTEGGGCQGEKREVE